MKRTIILVMAVAALLSSCKQNAKTATANTEKYEGTLRSKGTVRGAGNTYSIFPPDTLAPFVDELLSDVYSGKLQAYYFLPDSPDVERAIAMKDLDKVGSSIDTVVQGGKKEPVVTQFGQKDITYVSIDQKYFYDVATHKIRTEVTKVFFARDAYDYSDGTFLGAENMFYIKLK